MITAVATVVESASPSPSPARKRCRLGGPIVANGEGGAASTTTTTTTTTSSDFQLRHWRPAAAGKRAGLGMRRRWAPPEIEIPNGGGGGSGVGGRGYTSLRDILSSPEYAASSKSSSPADGGSAGGGDVHMIRHPLVKHAAYAYLQLTPSARDADATGRRRRRRRGPLCRLLLGCLGFVGALFGR
uniref:Uncharacterized protein n=1 Tax=Oryza punctata TaxID=4537 RepID=A0A0E0MCN2_ORYPU